MATYAHFVHTYREMFAMLINRTIEAFEHRSEIKFGGVRISKVAYQRISCSSVMKVIELCSLILFHWESRNE